MLHSRWHSFIWPLTFFVAIFGLGMVSITSCIAIGPGPNFDPEALDVQGGDLEIVIPAEHYILNAQVSPGGTWLAYAYEAQESNGRSSIYTMGSRLQWWCNLSGEWGVVGDKIGFGFRANMGVNGW